MCGDWAINVWGWSRKVIGDVVEVMMSERFGYRVPRDREGRGSLGWRGLGVECLGCCRGRVAYGLGA